MENTNGVKLKELNIEALKIFKYLYVNKISTASAVAWCAHGSVIFMPEQKILEAIKAARNVKRNFKQSFDLFINLKDIDMKRPESKIKTEVALPHGRGKDVKVCVIADSLIPQARRLESDSVLLIRKDELDDYGKSKKTVKKIARECEAFLAEASLMQLVGKNMGQVLAPRNKMPKPLPPTTADLKPVIEKAKNTIKIMTKDSPTIHCFVGTEDMKDEAVAENIEAVLRAVESALPKGTEQIKNVYVKLTMGKPVRC